MNQLTPTGAEVALGEVVFGAMTFGSQVDEVEAADMVAACRDAGITMFDTANSYNGGASEEILGRAVKPFRDEVTIATKVGNPVREDGVAVAGLSRTAIRAAVQGSLRRLGTDRIDVYYLHRPDRDTPISESLEALEELVRESKVGHTAQSNYAAWQITEMRCLAERNGWPRMGISQPMYNLLARRVEAEYEACSERLGLTNVVYNPLAGGLLTGKHRLEAQPANGARFSQETYRDRYWNAAQFRAVERLRDVADLAGLTLVELSLRWLLGRPLVDAVLLGASSLEQLRANLDALDGPPLDDDTLAACDDVWAGLEGAAPHYNR
ncbi:MAG: aldo/keto reductase [Euzebyales bacterium]|jgi:aryl-alcohol dehydrogenase-like predicted oxidoreductase|nr:aldo/keto reductase [Euzebyales bacterium]